MPPSSDAPFARSNCGQTCPYDSTVRALFTDNNASIYAWPSRGGVIILDDAEAIDFEFLGLNPLDPPEKRLEDQSAEDPFCQRLLLLGAKWWDSEARYFGGGTPKSWHCSGRRRIYRRERASTYNAREALRQGWMAVNGWILGR
jgi:hypothetical protein